MEKLTDLDVDWDVYASVDDHGQVIEIHPSRMEANASSAAYVKEVTPFAFQADLGFVRAGRKSSGTGFAEFEDRFDTIVSMSMQGLRSLLQEIKNGQILLTDEQRFRGIYYFRKRGKGVSVCAMPREKQRELGLDR